MGHKKITCSARLVPLSEPRAWALHTYPDINRYCEDRQNLTLPHINNVMNTKSLCRKKNYAVYPQDFKAQIAGTIEIVKTVIPDVLAQIVYEFLNALPMVFRFTSLSRPNFTSTHSMDATLFVDADDPFDPSKLLMIKDLNAEPEDTSFEWDPTKKRMNLNQEHSYSLSSYDPNFYIEEIPKA